ncbi:hypothetical protein MKX03_018712, partial [Papaver bracteatum]
MFLHIVLERNMQLQPRHFGPNLRDKLVAKLMKDYQCVVCRLFKEEILEAMVTMVNKVSSFLIKFIILLADGVFAEAGHVQIFLYNGIHYFVCLWLIPDDIKLQFRDIPNYTTSDGSVKIQRDSEVRLKIIGTRVDAMEI